MNAPCNAGLCQPTIVLSPVPASDLALSGSNLYYTTPSEGIWSTPTTGAADKLITTYQQPGGAFAVGATDLYYFDAGALKKIALAGGSPITLAAGPFVASGMAVDATNVYWSAGAGGKSTIWKVSISGGTPTTLATNVPGSVEGIVVGATHVYWANYTIINGSETSDLTRVPIAGGTPTTLATETKILALTLAGTRLYWTGFDASPDGRLKSLPITGGTPSVVAGGFQIPMFLAIDAVHAYVGDRGTGGFPPDGSVKRVRLDGLGPTLTLASGIDQLSGVVVDATRVYWSEFNSLRAVGK